MRLTVLGGGGFRVPLVYGALLRDHGDPRIDHVALHDVDAGRLRAVEQVLAQQAVGVADAPLVTATTVFEEALEGADFVFSAIRVGGLDGRSRDERVALDLGLLGQETTGPGGVAYGLRTVPVAVRIAETVARVAPDAHVINFTNPAGMVTEAMQQVLDRGVVGICDSPIGLARRAVRALGLDPARTHADYVGLNHLGWLRALEHDGVDVLPDLLADDAALRTIEEARLMGPDWVRTLGSLPNEYLYYWYFTRDAVRSIVGEKQTRGEFLRDQQQGFYDAVAARPDRALEEWHRVRREREETYMAEVREDDRDEEDAAGGGYEGVALAYMAAVMRGERTTMILDVRNGTAVPGLPSEAVVEVPSLVDGTGARPLATRPLDGHQLGLVQQVKAVEQIAIAAARTGDPGLVLKAFALHPLVDSVEVARELVRGYGLG
ncbi:MAG: 6-phospho-beta-glucosidase [Nocardioidaceae bacterium]|nr:6-phospho-beta-glucosidase [Nocardioidaceae bacterium]NUS51093.1 6-phospho-beta-glucosidase [Nocardioidaceae bacterium]